MNCDEIKKRAKEFAFKNKGDIWKPLLCIYAVILVVSFALGFILGFLNFKNENVMDLLTYIIDFALLPASIGYIYYLMNLIKGKKLDIKEALLSKYSLWVLIIITMVMVSLFTTLWSLLLIVPGIIYSLKTVMVQYILAEADNTVNYQDVINRSKQMMEGHKWEYVVFNFKFIGWILLGIVTLGIAYIWVYPYITISNLMYYEELKKLTFEGNK